LVKIVHWDSFLDLTGSEAVMVDENGVSISYGCLVQLSDEFARDIPQNSLVAVNSENSFEFVVVYLSALRNDFALLILPKKIEKDEQVKIFDKFKVNIHAILASFNAKSSDIKISKIKVHNTHGVNSKIKLLLMTSGTLSMPKFAKISLGSPF
jgi:acyl-CoA synthetase (AMP-forming)/AMP-acid ligase II